MSLCSGACVHAAHIKKINDLEKVLFEDEGKDFDKFDHSPAFGISVLICGVEFTNFVAVHATICQIIHIPKHVHIMAIK